MKTPDENPPPYDRYEDVKFGVAVQGSQEVFGQSIPTEFRVTTLAPHSTFTGKGIDESGYFTVNGTISAAKEFRMSKKYINGNYEVDYKGLINLQDCTIKGTYHLTSCTFADFDKFSFVFYEN